LATDPLGAAVGEGGTEQFGLRTQGDANLGRQGAVPGAEVTGVLEGEDIDGVVDHEPEEFTQLPAIKSIDVKGGNGEVAG